MKNNSKIALGGGCHWCTEAVFLSLEGVIKAEQGYVASFGESSAFSEAVIVHFNTEAISLQTLIEIHLNTHRSTTDHSMRGKYRSAVYVFSEEQKNESRSIIKSFQLDFENSLVTEILEFREFKPSREQITNYYYKNPTKPFCERFIEPKLNILLQKFSKHTNHRLEQLITVN